MDGYADDSPAKKRRSNVAKACVSCRRRKTKCDGAKPTCGTCAGYQDECTWDEDDGRRPASRAYVQSLRDRIRVLEVALGDRTGGTPPEILDGLEPELDVEAATAHMLHLQMGDHGEEVHFHGPTSAYAHVPSTPLLQPSAQPSPPAPYPDWTRHLPAQPLLAPAQHAQILGRFFRFFASWGLRAHHALFMRDMERALSLPAREAAGGRVAHYSPLLHNVVLALGSAFADEEELRADSAREGFVVQAKIFLDDEIAAPSLASVQALALLSSYYSTKGAHSIGYVYMGMADRAAISLGLNVDSSALVRAGRMSEEEMVLRNNTFWTIFIQEQAWAVYIGRPHAVGNYNTPLPQIDAALDQTLWQWDDPTQHSMLSSAFVETAKLSRLMQEIMSTVYSLKADRAKLLRDAHVSALSVALDTWHELLPAPLVLTPASIRNALPHVVMLHLAWEWLVILVWRPFYGGQDETAVRRCDRSADHILALLRTYDSRFGLRLSPPTLLNVAFTAGTTHLVSAAHHRSAKLCSHAVDGARACADLLRAATAWRAAADQAAILDRLIDAHLAERAAQDKRAGSARARQPVPSTPTTGSDGWTAAAQWGDFGFTFRPAEWTGAPTGEPGQRFTPYWSLAATEPIAASADLGYGNIPGPSAAQPAGAQLVTLPPPSALYSPASVAPPALSVSTPTLASASVPSQQGVYPHVGTLGVGLAPTSAPMYSPPLDAGFPAAAPWIAGPSELPHLTQAQAALPAQARGARQGGQGGLGGPSSLAGQGGRPVAAARRDTEGGEGVRPWPFHLGDV